MKKNIFFNFIFIIFLIIFIKNIGVCETAKTGIEIKEDNSMLLYFDRAYTGLVLLPTAYGLDKKHLSFNIDAMFTQYVGDFLRKDKFEGSQSLNPTITQTLTFDLKFAFLPEKNFLPGLAIGDIPTFTLDLGASDVRDKMDIPVFTNSFYFVLSKEFIKKTQTSFHLGFITKNLSESFAYTTEYVNPEKNNIIYLGIDTWFIKNKFGLKLEYIKHLSSEQNFNMLNFDFKGFTFPILLSYIKTNNIKTFEIGLNIRFTLFPRLDEEKFKKEGIIQRVPPKKRPSKYIEVIEYHCPRCGAEVTAGQETCPVCGAKLLPEKENSNEEDKTKTEENNEEDKIKTEENQDNKNIENQNNKEENKTNDKSRH